MELGQADPGLSCGSVQHIGHYFGIQTALLSDRQTFSRRHEGHGRNKVVNALHSVPLPKGPR